jgi:hypothetical protein
MKTCVITLSKRFPAGHCRAGEPTNFAHLLGNGLNLTDEGLRLCKHKIHTIRANYGFWAKRFEDINRGEACLSVRQWSEKPYNSPQVEIARLTKENGIGLQKLYWGKADYGEWVWFVDDVPNDIATNYSLAKNDGLPLNDWLDWFKDYNYKEPMAIIHFTKFRY